MDGKAVSASLFSVVVTIQTMQKFKSKTLETYQTRIPSPVDRDSLSAKALFEWFRNFLNHSKPTRPGPLRWWTRD